MDSSTSLPGRSSEPKPYKMASFVGTMIAVLTLTIPPLMITHYSTNNALEAILQTTSSVNRTGN